MAGGAANTVPRVVQCTCFNYTIMNNFGADVKIPDATPDVNHKRGIQYQIALNPIKAVILGPQDCVIVGLG